LHIRFQPEKNRFKLEKTSKKKKRVLFLFVTLQRNFPYETVNVRQNLPPCAV